MKRHSLPRDRQIGTVAEWLGAHPEIAVVDCDPAAANGAPQAVPVADRWHLMENASSAFSMSFGAPCTRSARLGGRPMRIVDEGRATIAYPTWPGGPVAWATRYGWAGTAHE